MEAFSKLVFRGIGRGYLASFSISDVNVQSLVISYLLVLFFLLISNLLLLTLPFKKKSNLLLLTLYDADNNQIQHLRCILWCFEAILSLKVNLTKSNMVPAGEEADLDILANTLECNVSSLPIKYLGLPVGAPFKGKRT